MTAIAAKDLQRCLTERAEARADYARMKDEEDQRKLRNGTITQEQIDEDKRRGAAMVAARPPDAIWEHAYMCAPGYVSSTDDSDTEEGRDKFATPPPSPRGPNDPDLSWRAWYKVYWNMVINKIQDPTRIGFDKYETWKALMLAEINEREQPSSMPVQQDKVSLSRPMTTPSRRVTRSKSKKNATFYELDSNGKTSHEISKPSNIRLGSSLTSKKARRISKQTYRTGRQKLMAG